MGFATGFYVGPIWVFYMGPIWAPLGPHIEFPIKTVPVTLPIEYNRFGAVASFDIFTRMMTNVQYSLSPCEL